MGQQKPTAMESNPDYIPPSKPGEMHQHALLGTRTGRQIGTQDEGAAQATRNNAIASLKSTGNWPANWDSRDVNLPVDKPAAAAKPKAQSAPRTATKAKGMSGRR